MKNIYLFAYLGFLCSQITWYLFKTIQRFDSHQLQTAEQICLYKAELSSPKMEITAKDYPNGKLSSFKIYSSHYEPSMEDNEQVLQVFFNISQNNLFHYFTRHRSETNRSLVFRALLLAVLENWDDVYQLPVSWDLFGLPRLLKNHQARFCDISQLIEDSWMNPIRPHSFLGIQLEKQISHKFRVNWDSIILAAMVFLPRALRTTLVHHLC